MCGIAGVVTWGAEHDLYRRIRAMTATLKHRGPDDQSTWVDEQRGIAFGHTRLAIIDLSTHGKQPMTCASGSRVVTYNGEIYNFKRLRQELERAGKAPSWRGHSDTEVLLAAVDAWGLDAALARFVGMFAFALWDQGTGTLTLARDRLGEKPLYYGVVDGRFCFASELKAMCAAAPGGLQINRSALATYMQFGYVSSPASIYAGIYKLQPGHSVVVRGIHSISQPRSYWTAQATGRGAGLIDTVTHDDASLLECLHGRLAEAVAGQMMSDVPLGAFLSGGVDSSMIVALMQAHSSRPVRTFTIGFAETGFDEAPFAKAVASHLGTDHTEMYLSARDAAELIPSLHEIYDEPFADSSQIPTTLIARMTRRHVTVALSGDGGDELFAGYPRYRLVAALWRHMAKLPASLRSKAATLLATPTPQAWDRALSMLPVHRREINGRRLHHLAELIASRSLAATYIRLISKWIPEDRLVLGAATTSTLPAAWVDDIEPVNSMRLWDIEHYLPDDLLVKVDRAAMSASLETRAPFLDHRVVELALALPKHLLIRGQEGKWAIRQLLDRYVPRQLIERPKAGFEVPLASWLRGPLRPWAESMLDSASIANQGYLDARLVSKMWKQHIVGDFDRGQHLWQVLMFQSWLRSDRPPYSTATA